MYASIACIDEWIFGLKSSGHVDLWDICGTKRALIDIPTFFRKSTAGSAVTTGIYLYY